MGESILKLQQIRKSFDHTEVLKGVDLEVAQGEFITLLGASGCGKTTTLRIIAGLELPDSGSVILEGRDITDWEPNKRDVNTVFQNYALFPHMNVADNVGYGLKIRKVPKAEIAERVKQALDNTEGAVMASARVTDPQGKDLFSYWTLLPLWKDLLDTGLITRRLFKDMLNTPPYRLPNAGDEGSRLVDAVPGSFFMLKPGLLTPQDIEGLFDSRIFLYYEEKVLGQKLASRGLTEVLVTDASYVHAHSVSIDKSVSAMAGKQRLLHESKLYYYENYLGTGPWGMFLARVYLRLVLWEVWLLTGGWKRKRHG